MSGGPSYRRILLKLSGEALTGDSSFGIDPHSLKSIAASVRALHDMNVQVAMVVGAGNIFRGRDLMKAGMERVSADQIGMLGTVMNALAMQDILESEGLPARVMSAISMNEVCEDYIRRRAVRHLEKGRVVLFAGGIGNPLFTTDSAASLRAIEIGADLLVKATKVDGVFTADPLLHPGAERYEHLDYDRVLSDKLGVMDATAIVLCRDHGMPLRVIDMNKADSLLRAVSGEDEGTLVDGAP